MQTHKLFTFITCLFGSGSFFICCEPSTPSAFTEADKHYILDLTTSVQDDWNRGDRERYVNRFSEDAIYMVPNMETISGKDAIRSFANSFPQLRVEFSIIEIMGSAEYAYVRGSFILTNPKDSLFDKGKFLSIWKKTPNNKWLLTHDMFSSDLPLTGAKGKTNEQRQNRNAF